MAGRDANCGWPGLGTLPITVSLRRMFSAASFVACADLQVTHAVDHSSECRPGSLFAAIPGTCHHGQDFVHEAIRRGATGLLVSRPVPDARVPQCVVRDVRGAYSRLQAALAGQPDKDMKTLAVTGTNGKTTVAWMLRSIIQSAGSSCGLLGTIEYSDSVETLAADLTTPGTATFWSWMQRMARQGATHACMELSSHALHQGRVAGLGLDVAVLTNITQDHFDYHANFDDYLASKGRILDLLRVGGTAVVNNDDARLQRLIADRRPQRVVTFGVESQADVRATILEESLQGSSFLLSLHGDVQPVHLQLPGRHNISNALAAAAAASAVGLPLTAIVAGLGRLQVVPGRLERVDIGGAVNVFVDYAHTDDALRRSLRALRGLTNGRLLCVFGAGGDRDRSKRPLLGRAAVESADVVIVTSDNPRSEQPEAIIADILAGANRDFSTPIVEVDRQGAIALALQMARPGDCVLVAGKGHERVQIVGNERRPFDDRQAIRSAWQAMIRDSCPPLIAVSPAAEAIRN